MPLAREYIAPMLSDVTSKYFVDRSGVQTRRMANVAGKGHFDLAQEILGTSTGDLYGQMHRLGYIRVMETPTQIHVESPNAMTSRQKRFLQDRAIETRKEIMVNNRDFIESKDPRAAAHAVVEQLVS